MEKHIYDEKNGLRYTLQGDYYLPDLALNEEEPTYGTVSYTHLRAHETDSYLVCRLLLEKKKKRNHINTA